MLPPWSPVSFSLLADDLLRRPSCLRRNFSQRQCISPSFPSSPGTTLGEPQFAPSFLDAEWEVSSCGPMFPVPCFKAKNDSQKKKKKKKDCPGSVPIRCQPEVKLMHPFLGAISNPKIP